VKAYEQSLEALADPTRRAIFDRIKLRALPVGEIATGLPVSRPAVSQHLRILKEAGLVTERRQGARRLYRADPAGLASLHGYIEDFWKQALDSYKRHLDGEEN
jgi:DNA-binding transcriptional ArsR family regulator